MIELITIDFLSEKYVRLTLADNSGEVNTGDEILLYLCMTIYGFIAIYRGFDLSIFR